MESISSQLKRLIEEESYADACDLIEEHLQAGGVRAPQLLRALALCVYRHGVTVMVDQVLPRSQRALDLLDEALSTSSPEPRDSVVLRREIEHLRDAFAKEEQRSASKKMKPEGALTSEELQTRAHRAWDQRDLPEAARLFLGAADRARAEAIARSRVDRSFSARIRAGLCLFDAGLREEARPILDEALTFDWLGARLRSDCHMMEWAFFRCMLEAAEHRDLSRFRDLWTRAVRRGEELKYPFPSIHPHQERLLELCAQLGLAEQCAHLVSFVPTTRSRVPAKVKALLAAAERCARGG